MVHLEKHQESSYRLLESVEEEGDAGKLGYMLSGYIRQKFLFPILICCVTVVLFITGFASGAYLKDFSIWGLNRYTSSSVGCKDPPLRREWRSLDR